MRASFFVALVSVAQFCAARPMNPLGDLVVVSPAEDLKRSPGYNKRAQTANIQEIGCPYPYGYNHLIYQGQTPNILLVGQETVNGELNCRYEASKLPTSTGLALLQGRKQFEYGSCSYSFIESITRGYRGIKRWERVDETVNGFGDRAMLAEKKFIFCPVLPGLTPEMTMRITPPDHLPNHQ